MTENHHHLPSELEVPSEAPDRNLALELVRVTEAAAMAAGRWVGVTAAGCRVRAGTGAGLRSVRSGTSTRDAVAAGAGAGAGVGAGRRDSGTSGATGPCCSGSD